MEVILRKGDIAQCEANVLVNSTTSSLDLTSGHVTQSILEAGGDTLQTQCNSNYPDGITNQEIAITDGGDLPCSHVYHVSLPDWTEESNVEGVIKSVMSQCLSTADQDSESIAFPALGTGTLNYPADFVARCLFETVAEFFENDNSNLETVFVILKPGNIEVIQAFTAAAANYADNDNLNIITDFEDEDDDDENYFEDDDDENYYEDDDENAEECVSDLFDFSLDYEENESEKVEVLFVEGDITAQTVDVVVNSTVPNLNLSSGPLTKAILQGGGDSLQEECKSKYPNGITEKDFAVTSAGNLPCQFVYHTTSCHWNAKPETEQKLRDLIKMVLQEADNSGLSSIAIPAIGTGVLKYPTDVVARCMYETVYNFCPNSLEQVFLVVRSSDKEVVKAYKSEQENHAPRYPSSDGTFKITVVKGDIAQQNAEVIVNSTTPTLNLSSGPVTKAILKAGGDNLQQECKQKYPNGIKLGEIAETAGGNLTCQSIYHVTLRKWSNDPPCRQSFCDLIFKCLKRASDTGRTSIAFPVLGTGTLKYPRDTVAECVFESFDKFSSSSPGTSLTEACIVVHPTDVENLKIFEDVSAAQANPGQSVIFSDMSEFFSFDTACELASEISLPAHWSPMTNQDFVCKVQLSPANKEYKMVERNFITGIGQSARVEKIERIQNKTLHVQYKMHKHRMSTENPGIQVERHLWHGTGYDAIPSINIYGFSRSYTGKNATVYGEGTYFAVSSSYSAQTIYSPPNNDGKRHMYMAAVLTGNYTEGDSGMRVLPPRDPSNPHVLYDTAVDDVNNPSIFVVFHDVQAYPQYLVTFT